jgi:hypothetical protein
MTTMSQTVLLLLAVLVVVAIVARRLNTAPSILLVIAGVGLALAPGLPRIELAPELVLLGILPPLIYSAGVAMSWREFRFNLRPITLLAFGCVSAWGPSADRRPNPLLRRDGLGSSRDAVSQASERPPRPVVTIQRIGDCRAAQ